MNEHEEVPDGEKDKDAFHAEFVVPKRYRLRTSDGDLYLARSKFAVLAMLLARIVSGIGCIAVLCFGVVALVVGINAGSVGTVACAVLGTPVAFMLQFATFVVFVRVDELWARYEETLK